MNTAPTLDELRDVHRRCTYYVIQELFKGNAYYYGCWLYSQDGKPGTHSLSEAEQASVFSHGDNSSALAAIKAMSLLVRSYLVTGGEARTALAKKGAPLPRAIVLVAPPLRLAEGEVVKTFVLTEHQTYLADSPVEDGGKGVRLGDLELQDASLAHNRPSGPLN